MQTTVQAHYIYELGYFADLQAFDSGSILLYSAYMWAESQLRQTAHAYPFPHPRSGVNERVLGLACY